MANKIIQLKDGNDNVYPIAVLDEANYIVDEGTSGIWTYRKWASGVAECWGEATFNDAFTSSYGNAWYTTHSSYSLPSGLFNSAPTAVASVRRGGGILFVSFYAMTSTYLSFYIGSIKQEATAADTWVDFHVNGTWK